MEILYSDDRVAVCIKPVGILSTDEPGGMPQLLRERLGEGTAVVRAVHRLDQQVGGLMVYARTARAASDLGKQMQEGLFYKEYRAVVQGTPVEEQGTFRDLLWRDKKARKTYVASEPGPDVREAVLDYRVLESREGLSLCAVRLYTGRTHQIRCQFSSRCLPLVGDRKYGAGAAESSVALWSYKLAFFHPRTGERMEFEKVPPETFPWTVFDRS